MNEDGDLEVVYVSPNFKKRKVSRDLIEQWELLQKLEVNQEPVPAQWTNFNDFVQKRFGNIFSESTLKNVWVKLKNKCKKLVETRKDETVKASMDTEVIVLDSDDEKSFTEENCTEETHIRDITLTSSYRFVERYLRRQDEKEDFQKYLSERSMCAETRLHASDVLLSKSFTRDTNKPENDNANADNEFSKVTIKSAELFVKNQLNDFKYKHGNKKKGNGYDNNNIDNNLLLIKHVQDSKNKTRQVVNKNEINEESGLLENNENVYSEKKKIKKETEPEILFIEGLAEDKKKNVEIQSEDSKQKLNKKNKKLDSVNNELVTGSFEDTFQGLKENGSKVKGKSSEDSKKKTNKRKHNETWPVGNEFLTENLEKKEQKFNTLVYEDKINKKEKYKNMDLDEMSEEDSAEERNKLDIEIEDFKRKLDKMKRHSQNTFQLNNTISPVLAQEVEKHCSNKQKKQKYLACNKKCKNSRDKKFDEFSIPSLCCMYKPNILINCNCFTEGNLSFDEAKNSNHKLKSSNHIKTEIEGIKTDIHNDKDNKSWFEEKVVINRQSRKKSYSPSHCRTVASKSESETESSKEKSLKRKRKTKRQIEAEEKEAEMLRRDLLVDKLIELTSPVFKDQGKGSRKTI